MSEATVYTIKMAEGEVKRANRENTAAYFTWGEWMALGATQREWIHEMAETLDVTLILGRS